MVRNLSLVTAPVAANLSCLIFFAGTVLSITSTIADVLNEITNRLRQRRKKMITNDFRFYIAMSLVPGLIWTSAAWAEDPLFAPAVHYAAGDGAKSVAIGDFDNDQALDLAVANFLDDNVSVLLGLGDGTFVLDGNYTAGDAYSVTIGDLNGDQVLDLVVADNYRDYVRVLLGIGDGSFGTAVRYNAGNGPWQVAIGDFDGDEVPDLAVANEFSNDVSVLLGYGNGTFASAMHYAAGDAPYSVASDDLNDDQVLDLAVANYRDDNVSVLLGRGDGTFTAAVNYPADDACTDVAIGDLNGDQVPDLAVANDYGDSVSVLLGIGNGTFNAAVHYAAGNGPYSVAIGDLDGDQVPDLALAAGIGASVLLGIGDGTFGTAEHYAAGAWPNSVAIGDLNGDQAPDLAVANVMSDTVSVLLNLSSQRTVAPLTSFGIETGSLLNGVLSDLESSDDSYIHTRSGFGQTLVDLHSMEMFIVAEAPGSNPTTIDLTIESLIDEPAGLAQIRMKNYNTNDFDVVGSYSIGNTDAVEVISGIDASKYYNSNNGRMRVKIKHLVFVPFLAFTFESFIDQVEIVVE